jgi:hypothetical protein
MRMVLADWRKNVLRWVFWAIIAGVPLVWMRGARALFVVGPIVLLLSGWSVVGRLGEGAKTPLSFCLPGFRESLRRRYFSGAAAVGLAGALFALELNLFLTRREVGFDGGALTGVGLQVVNGFLVGMAVALVAGTPRLILSRWAWNVLMLLSIPLVLMAIVAFPAFIAYPTVGIPVCGGLCLFVWLQLGDKAVLKRGHRMIIEDAIERGHETPTKNGMAWWATSRDAVTVLAWVEGLFRERMQNHPYFSVERYVWGTLYETFGPWLSYWAWILFALAGTALILALFGNGIAPSLALLYFVFLDRTIRLPMTSTLLLPGGRSEKCHATSAKALAASLLLGGAAVAAAVLARIGVLLVSAALPGGTDGLPDILMGMAGLLLPCVWLPTILAMELMREGGRWIASIAWVLLFASLMLIPFWRSAWPDWWAFVLLAAMSVFGWAFFLLTLRAACRRWDMGQQRVAKNG